MEPVRLRDLAIQLDAELVGDGDVMIRGVAGLDHAGHGDITFLARQSLLSRLAACQASAVIIGPGTEPDRPALRVSDPYGAFVLLLKRLAPPLDHLFPPGIHSTAVIAPTAELGARVSIGPGAVIGERCKIGSDVRLGPHVVLEPDVTIGDDCVLFAHVVIRERCRLGCRVLLHPSCVIGADGFGFLPTKDGVVKIPQVGIVILQDDVELGAGTCIDRATTGETVIGEGTKLDNMVQVGHNVRIGQRCVVSAQTGIAGSCSVADDVFMGGQVGLADHIHIGNGVRIGAKSGVHKSVADGDKVFGYPALDAGESMRIAAALRRLPDLLKRVGRLERLLDDEQIKGDG
jgi:UDP-3-O-[3-hydroxymyristoyl] glucosamine N-acyltransferase